MQSTNRYGVLVTWIDGNTSEYWYRTPSVQEYMAGSFEDMKKLGWDPDDPELDGLVREVELIHWHKGGTL